MKQLNPKIEAQVKLIHQKIQDLEVVKQMKSLEQQIEQESDFLDIEQSLFDLQKKMVQYGGDLEQYNVYKKEYEQKKAYLESQPLYVNYRYYLELTNELIVSIQAQLKTIGEKQ